MQEWVNFNPLLFVNNNNKLYYGII